MNIKRFFTLAIFISTINSTSTPVLKLLPTLSTWLPTYS